MRRRLSLASVIVLTACLWTGNAAATILQFDASLDGFQEVPPNFLAGSGDGTLFLNDATGDYTISGSFSDLYSPTTAAHIHGPALPGIDGVIIHGLTIPPLIIAGVYSGANTFTGPQMAELIAGLYYVNIHSIIYPNGEIRGQLTLVPEPASAVLLALGGIAAITVARRRRRAN